MAKGAWKMTPARKAYYASKKKKGGAKTSNASYFKNRDSLDRAARSGVKLPPGETVNWSKVPLRFRTGPGGSKVNWKKMRAASKKAI